MAVAPLSFVRLLPGSGRWEAASTFFSPLPAGWCTGLLAVPLMFTIVSPRGWRRTAQAAPVEHQTGPVYSPIPASSETMAYTPQPTSATVAPQSTPAASYSPSSYEIPTVTSPTVAQP